MLGIWRFADQPITSWRNGRGVTREIIRQPADGAFDWRVSIADVAEDGEFSTFPGVERIIMFCDGPAMTIVVDGTEHALSRHAPFTFPGEAATHCHIPNGPTRDLNVMTRRGRCTAEVLVPAGHCRLELEDRRQTLVVALTGTHQAHLAAPTGPIQLDVFDVAYLSGVGQLWITGNGQVAVIHIHINVDAATGAGTDI